MDEAAVQRLLQVIAGQEPSLNPLDWARQLSANVEGVDPLDIREITEAVMSLYSVRSYLGLSIDALAKDIAESSDLSLPKDRRVPLRNRLVSLLASEPLYVTSKAWGILTEEEHTFHDARIVTEVRPIFREDPSARPAAVTIVHLLKIQYHEGTSLQNFFVLLTEGGTSKLRETLDRADRKWHSLRSLMDEAHMPVLGQEEE